MADFITTSPLAITTIDKPPVQKPFHLVGEVVEVHMQTDATLPIEIVAPSAMGDSGKARCIIEHVAWFEKNKSWIYFLRRCVKESRCVDEHLVALERDISTAMIPYTASLPSKLREKVRWPVGDAETSLGYNDPPDIQWCWIPYRVQFSQVTERYEYDLELIIPEPEIYGKTEVVVKEEFLALQ